VALLVWLVNKNEIKLLTLTLLATNFGYQIH